MISTDRRVQYALGYISLGLLDQASDELESVSFDQRFAPAVVRARLELHMASSHWDVVVSFASDFAPAHPNELLPWVHWAYALRELNRVAEARDVLLRAEALHDRAIIHYNLACYYCLLGDIPVAKERLRRACKLDAKFKASALDDPDLRAMRNHIETLE